MKYQWFKPWGWVYRPASWPGLVLLFLAAAFCVNVFLAIDRHSHSATDTLYGCFPFFACVFLLLNWIAAKTSGTDNF